MGKSRLEAFSDGVFAIIITIMVLELKVPHGGDLSALAPLVPVFLGYVLSFLYVGIYWNNHHHMLHAARRINGACLWANLHLLFWLSLVPFVTGWLGENPSAAVPTASYGVVLIFSGIAYSLLRKCIVAINSENAALLAAVAQGPREALSTVLYASAIGLAFVHAWIAEALFVVVAILWVVPDRRIEKAVLEGKP